MISEALQDILPSLALNKSFWRIMENKSEIYSKHLFWDSINSSILKWNTHKIILDIYLVFNTLKSVEHKKFSLLSIISHQHQYHSLNSAGHQFLAGFWPSIFIFALIDYNAILNKPNQVHGPRPGPELFKGLVICKIKSDRHDKVAFVSEKIYKLIKAPILRHFCCFEILKTTNYFGS